MFVLATNAKLAAKRSLGIKTDAKRIADDAMRGGQKSPQAHGINPCAPRGHRN